MPDAQDVKLKLDPEGKFCFSAVSGTEKIPYEVDIDLYDKVDINVYDEFHYHFALHSSFLLFCWILVSNCWNTTMAGEQG